MRLPVTTPCAHNFCKDCVQEAFAGKTFVRKRLCFSGQALRSHKNVMKCPSCPADISEFLQNPQVNRDLMDLIQSLQCDTKEGGTHSSREFEKVDPVNCSSNLDDEKKNETNAEDKSEDSPNGKKTVGRGRGRPRGNGRGGEGRGRGCCRPLKINIQANDEFE
ncbi:E3 ubiquitin-protein ligase ORTHRUS 2 [Vitis vinifera]|uniref:E3 ubiquitin-protein ligase ORTHRUS 2 n=1 Tax=Vitis vinifera TaxID=29760 RepID=A0A438EYA5_VITVI|nr:E3 ubiquitin-protein ligase ORTHRUS 2 [Vitis vinifera]